MIIDNNSRGAAQRDMAIRQGLYPLGVEQLESQLGRQSEPQDFVLISYLSWQLQQRVLVSLRSVKYCQGLQMPNLGKY
jgi:hypothetical protein